MSLWAVPLTTLVRRRETWQVRWELQRRCGLLCTMLSITSKRYLRCNFTWIKFYSILFCFTFTIHVLSVYLSFVWYLWKTSFKITSPAALGPSYDCLCCNEAALADKNKYITWITWNNLRSKKIIHKKPLCILMEYTVLCDVDQMPLFFMEINPIIYKSCLL